MRLFFANLNGFSVFFSRSAKRVEYLDKSVARRIPRSSQTRWNFHSRIFETVHRHQHDLVACFEEITASWNGDQLTVREASGLLHWLQDKDFLLYLEFFHRIFPHVEILFAQLQKRGIDPAFIQGCIANFVDAMNSERSKIHALLDTDMLSTSTSHIAKRPRIGDSSADKSSILHEVCDILISNCATRFQFAGHLVAANLFDSESFAAFEQNFPCHILKMTVESYPILDEGKLKTELGVIYCRKEFRQCCGALALLQLLTESNLTETYSEVVKLLNVLVTTPMSSSEAERCFSTLKRVKTFLRNTMSEERLNALAILSMEKRLVRDCSNHFQAVWFSMGLFIANKPMGFLLLNQKRKTQA